MTEGRGSGSAPLGVINRNLSAGVRIRQMECASMAEAFEIALRGALWPSRKLRIETVAL
jgi:hypothetical protein